MNNLTYTHHIIPYFNYTDLEFLKNSEINAVCQVISDNDYHFLKLLESIKEKPQELWNNYITWSFLKEGESHRNMWFRCKREIDNIDDPAFYSIKIQHTRLGTNNIYQRNAWNQLNSFPKIIEWSNYFNKFNTIFRQSTAKELLQNLKLSESMNVLISIYLVNPTNTISFDELTYIFKYVKIMQLDCIIKINKSLWRESVIEKYFQQADYSFVEHEYFPHYELFISNYEQ